MKKYITLKNGVGVVLGMWIVFSSGYILHDQWKKFQSIKLTEAYQAGVSNSVQSLIDQSKKCEPIKVFKDEEEVNLIAIECLQPPAENESTNEGE